MHAVFKVGHVQQKLSVAQCAVLDLVVVLVEPIAADQVPLKSLGWLQEQVGLRWTPMPCGVCDLHMQMVQTLRKRADIKFGLPRAFAERRGNGLRVVLVEPIAAGVGHRLRPQRKAGEEDGYY